MRKNKRHSPTWFETAEKRGRGTGTYIDYLPLHANTRFDPSPHSRAHCVLWRGRDRQLLADNELKPFLFATMIPAVDDIREQFPLSHEAGTHELRDYTVDCPNGYFPGTLEICEALKIKHPKTTEPGRSALWWMSTDLLITLKNSKGRQFLVAVSIKLSKDIQSKRTRELLQIEKMYWESRGVKWLLITPDLYCNFAALTLISSSHWAMNSILDQPFLTESRDLLGKFIGLPISTFLKFSASQFGSMDIAQRALWQNIWNGDVPMDIRRGWRPHLPIEILGKSDFAALNPIASGRTAWN